MSGLKNDLLLRTLRGETTERIPVWMMRQAGRYLPEYMQLREKYGFFERVQTPELAAAITIQPIDIIGVDAAILFSDIPFPNFLSIAEKRLATKEKGKEIPIFLAKKSCDL